MDRFWAAVGFLMITAMILVGCDVEKVIYVERSGCLACHRPVDETGEAHGIEEAHPPVEGHTFTCEGCHGGDPEARKQWEAHVSPGIDGDPFIKNLTLGELDDLDPAYLQFINPGDLRVAQQSCGTGIGANCHGSMVETLKTNQMATFSGELGIARYRAGIQNSPAGVKAVYDVRDDSFVLGEVPGTVGSLEKMEEPQVPAGTTEIGPYQDIYLTKACMRCHLWTFGDNKFTGDFRSSGCSACHVLYRNDGTSQSLDPVIEKSVPPHPQKHIITSAIPSEQCLHCHYRGGRIGLSFQGYREGAGPGYDDEKVGFLGEPLHGHDANFYIDDEDVTNDIDETPPDVHFEAGMDCIDCHFSHDVHGDGHIYTSTQVAVEVRCKDCHGTNDEVTTMITRLGNKVEALEKDENGDFWLTTKVSGKRLKVPQVKAAIGKASHSSHLFKSMGRDENGFSHLDSMTCHTCHSAWMPSCYGCHVTADMREVQRSLISGVSTPGRLSGARQWVATDDLVLMVDHQGMISPSMPSERMFFTAIDGAGNVVIDNQVRRGPNGEVGFGQRAFNPHTIRRWSPWMRCDRCHLVEGTHSNQEQFNLTVGFGTDRYITEDGDGNEYRLDQLLTPDYEPTVLVGHNQPETSHPLTQEIIERMQAVEVPDLSCPVPGDVAVPYAVIQDTIFTPSCALSKCHDSTTAKENLDLTAENSYLFLVGLPSNARPGATLVIPGNPAGSYLIQKLIDNGIMVGERMPLEASALEECQIDMIRGWIKAGAKY